MLRMRILGASMLALAVGTGAAGAADIYAPPPPEVVYNPAPAFTWTGDELPVGLYAYTVEYAWQAQEGLRRVQRNGSVSLIR